MGLCRIHDLCRLTLPQRQPEPISAHQQLVFFSFSVPAHLLLFLINVSVRNAVFPPQSLPPHPSAFSQMCVPAPRAPLLQSVPKSLAASFSLCLASECRVLRCSLPGLAATCKVTANRPGSGMPDVFPNADVPQVPEEPVPVTETIGGYGKFKTRSRRFISRETQPLETLTHLDGSRQLWTERKLPAFIVTF